MYFFFQLEHRDVAASQTLRAALSKVEAAHPGFSYDFVLGLVRKADANNVNMNESLLRLQGAVSDQDCKLKLGHSVEKTEIYSHLKKIREINLNHDLFSRLLISRKIFLNW